MGGYHDELGRERLLVIPFEVINPLDCWKREGGLGELGGGLGGGLGERGGGGPVLPIRSCVVRFFFILPSFSHSRCSMN